MPPGSGHGGADDRPPAPRSALGAVRAMAPYLWPADSPGLRIRVVVALLLLVSAKVLAVTVPVFFSQAVDTLSGASADAAIGDPLAALAAAGPIALVLGYGIVGLLQRVFIELRDAVFVHVSQRAVRRVGLGVFRHLHGLSLRFHLDRRTGSISRILERGTDGIEFLLRFALFRILPTFVEFVLVCAVMWTLLDPWFVAIAAGTMATYVGFTALVTEWRTRFRREVNDSDNDAATKAVDALINYETVKYFGNEAHEALRFDRAQARLERASIISQTTLSILNIGQALILAVGMTGSLLLASRQVIDGALTIGGFVLVHTYLMQLAVPLNMLGFVYREIRRALVDMEQMFDLLAREPEVSDPPDAPDLPAGPGEIRFEAVHFGYHPERPILRDVSFTVPAGRTVAIVGPSGAGKSTIARLLFRFYDVSGGRILVDGQDIRTVSQASLRARIGVVPQDTVLFNDTLAYNIAYGRPGATRAEVEQAAKLAHIHDFARSLPDGYQTMVGERGLKLSGGEKQRVAIARTILKQPTILLFDEATSALDSHTEKDIQASLDEVSADRTTVVVAHRLSTVVDADEILVLDGGRIVERGCHAALLAENGAYAALWHKQQSARAAGADPRGVLTGATAAA